MAGKFSWVYDAPTPPDPPHEIGAGDSRTWSIDPSVYQQRVAQYNADYQQWRSKIPNDQWNAALQAGVINQDGTPGSYKPNFPAAPPGYAWGVVNDPHFGKPDGSPINADPSRGQVWTDPVTGDQYQAIKKDSNEWYFTYGPLLASVGAWAPALISGAGALTGAGGITDSTLTGSLAEGAPASGALSVPAEGAGYVAPSLGAEGPFIPGAGAVGDPAAAFGGGATIGDLTNAGAGSEQPTIGQPTPTPSNPYADNPLFQGNPGAPVYQPGGQAPSYPDNNPPQWPNSSLNPPGAPASNPFDFLTKPVIPGSTLTIGDLLVRGGLGAAGALIAQHGINSAGNQIQQGITNAVAGATGILGGGGGGGATGAPGGGVGAPGTTGAAGTPGGGATGLPGGTGTPYGSVPLGPSGYAGGTLGMWNPYVQAGYDALNRLGSRPASNLYDRFGQPIAMPTLTLGQLARPKFPKVA